MMSAACVVATRSPRAWCLLGPVGVQGAWAWRRPSGARGHVGENGPGLGAHHVLAVTAATARTGTRRWQTSSQRRRDSDGAGAEKASLSQVLRAALRQGLDFRTLFGAFRGQNLRKLFRQSPEEVVFAFAILIGLAGCVVYVVYEYFHYFQSEQFTRFPPAVAKSIRRALYYSNYNPDAKLALKYYKLALQQCDDLGVDPFSDEALGLKIQLAAWLEKIGSYQNSIDVLEAILRDCKRWVDKMEQTVRDGGIDQMGYPIGLIAEAKSAEQESDQVLELPENVWAKRTRLLGRSVGISVKLGELYADPHVLQGDNAGQCLIWAVDTVLHELQRRRDEGLRPDEGEWMSAEQTGSALEALANHYESRSQHYLAVPLFLQALTLSPPKTCHTAVLMNNLAISLAQQPLQRPFDDKEAKEAEAQVRPTRAKLLASARSWALKAHETGKIVEGEARTAECDEACAVALCNLGEIAAMSGEVEEAKRRFHECLKLSVEIAFEPAIEQAQDGLKALANTARTCQ